MQSRILLFFILLYLAFAANSLIWNLINPAPPAKQVAADDEGNDAKDNDAKDNDAKEGDDAKTGDAEDSNKPPAGVDANGAPKGGEKPAAELNQGDPKPGEPPPRELEPQADTPVKFATLGSLDPDSEYEMLVTLTNRGAAIQRIELNTRRYHDPDPEDLSGYIGELELTEDASGGCQVNVVGPGTPAAEAGIEVGDVLTHLDGEAADTPEKFAALLHEVPANRDVQIASADAPRR